MEIELAVNGIEALLLISLQHRAEKPLFDENQVSQFRNIISAQVSPTMKRFQEERIIFTLSEIKAVEQMLPIYGTIDESKFGPLRVKLSEAIRKMEADEFGNDLITNISSWRKANGKSSKSPEQTKNKTSH